MNFSPHRFRYLYEREDVVGLEICEITVEDEGEYACVADNKHGRAESSCEIFVNGIEIISLFPVFFFCYFINCKMLFSGK